MAINELLSRAASEKQGGTVWNGKTPEPSSDDNAYQELKARIHYKLLDVVDLNSLENMLNGQRVSGLPGVIEQILTTERVPLNLEERKRLIDEVQNEMLGLGPLEPLLNDPTVSDILVNGYKTVFVERKGRLEKADIRFKDDAHLLKIISKIVSKVGRRIDESSPLVDARLADGSRVNAIIPPLALDGPALSIRRFAVDPLKMDDLLKLGTITSEMALLLQGAVKARLNVLISGGTGAGKTTFLNVLSGFIPDTERIVTIEDSAELQLQQQHIVRLETRPPNIEGQGQITSRDLVRNSLRMRPDRIVVGEVRGEETLDMLQAMNTGHDGSLTTVHANSARDALTRIETMVAMAGLNQSDRAVRHQVSSALDIIIQAARLSDGSRKLLSVSEITGMEGDIVTMQDIFVFEQTGIGEGGRVKGRFKATGIRPKFLSKLHASGIDISPTLFEPGRVYEVIEPGRNGVKG
ncbi:MAG TPA: CpaF family protein [Nitrospiria bacterium]